MPLLSTILKWTCQLFSSPRCIIKYLTCVASKLTNSVVVSTTSLWSSCAMLELDCKLDRPPDWCDSESKLILSFCRTLNFDVYCSFCLMMITNLQQVTGFEGSHYFFHKVKGTKFVLFKKTKTNIFIGGASVRLVTSCIPIDVSQWLG